MTHRCRMVWACAAGLMGLAGSAFGQFTGQFEIRFVAVDGLASSPNQGLVGLSSGTVLGTSTQVTPVGGTIRQRIAMQLRTVNIGGTYTTTWFNSDYTASVRDTVLPAQNLGVAAFSITELAMSDGQILSRSVNSQVFQGGFSIGTVVGSSWRNFLAGIPPTFGPSAWSYDSPTPPPPPVLTGIGAGGEWVTAAAFTWQTANLSPRTTTGQLFVDQLLALTGYSLHTVDFPSPADELDGAVTYSVGPIASLLSLPIASPRDFSFTLQQNQSPVVTTTPKQLVADPLVNPDAMSVVLASITDPEGQSVSASITDDGGIGLLGGMVSVEGNGSSSPLIVLTWDAPNSAIGQTFTVSFEYSDALNGPLTGTALVTVIPSPGALMVLGLGGLIAAARRRHN